MCLAVPVKVLEKTGKSMARVEMDGVRLEVSTALCPEINVNDYVIIHAGFIIEKLEHEDVQEKLALWEEYYEKTGQKK
ncbi:MAG: HypC/HybG/HupF family hydrogenase formation chaperone [Bacteriovoracaceae bacterium]|nr:HypC/HybG/HupF family hydrogenase formation chaperone [Bacteriovoracaceae bacterium]